MIGVSLSMKKRFQNDAIAALSPETEVLIPEKGETMTL